MENEGINVLSLFDGMSCGMLALLCAGVKVNKYFASEIDKSAIFISQKNFPDIIRLGDVTKVKGSELPKIHLIIGGSPCQGFSISGKQLNFDDPRSKLFFEFTRLMEECKPDYFLLENVRMLHDHEAVITRAMGVNSILINSALVSAQNRERLYWTNIGQVTQGLFGEAYPGIKQPADNGIMLKDVLCTEVPEKYFLSEAVIAKMGEWALEQENEKNNGLVQIGNIYPNEHNSVAGRVYTDKGKSVTLSALGGGGGAKTGLYQISDMEKSNSITPDAYLTTGRRKRDADGKAVLTSMWERRIRRLMPVECERLQTVPDGYTAGVSDSQRYKMLGNGWTIDVIAHILGYLPNSGPYTRVYV